MAKKYKNFVGIDVSKDKLDLCILSGQEPEYLIIGNSKEHLRDQLRNNELLSQLNLAQ